MALAYFSENFEMTCREENKSCLFLHKIKYNFQAKADGFLPGGASLHSCMTPHGPDTKTYEVNHSPLIVIFLATSLLVLAGFEVI